MVKHSMIFWNYYASVIWTETWTFWGEPCGSWWTASWTPRFPPRSALSTANAVRRRTYRNGYRNRTWDTRVGYHRAQYQWSCTFPRCGKAATFPACWNPRRRSEKAPLAVIQQAYVEGVSTRRVDDLIKALGCDGISSKPGVAHLRATGRSGGEFSGLAFLCSLTA